MLNLWHRTRTGLAVFATYTALVAWWCSAGVWTGVCAFVAAGFWLVSGE